MPRDTTDPTGADEAGLLTEQRRKASRLGLLLWIFVGLVVAAVFAWKLSLQR